MRCHHSALANMHSSLPPYCCPLTLLRRVPAPSDSALLWTSLLRCIHSSRSDLASVEGQATDSCGVTGLHVVQMLADKHDSWHPCYLQGVMRMGTR